MTTDADDALRVRASLHRLRTIANQLTQTKRRTDALYAERMLLVHQLRGSVSQQDLADACGCGVDMVKNIAANARRKFDGNGATL